MIVLKKKIIIIVSIIIVIFITYFLYRQFGPDITILLNYEVNMPVPDKAMYKYEEFGKDGGYYRVVKYSDKKLRKIGWRNYHDDNYNEKMCTNNTKLELKDANLLEFFEKNETPKDYQPEIDEKTLYYKKRFKNKGDYLLMIYNPNNNIVYIYEFHI